MQNITLVQVTTFSATSRHYVAQHEQNALDRTLCGHRPVHLGQRISGSRYKRAPLDQRLLDKLPMCNDCARYARNRGLLPSTGHPRPLAEQAGFAPADTHVYPQTALGGSPHAQTP